MVYPSIYAVELRLTEKLRSFVEDTCGPKYSLWKILLGPSIPEEHVLGSFVCVLGSGSGV